jgi:hypothetical protein
MALSHRSTGVLESWSIAKALPGIHWSSIRFARTTLILLLPNLFNRANGHIAIGTKTRPILLSPIFIQHSNTPVLHYSDSLLSAEPMTVTQPCFRPIGYGPTARREAWDFNIGLNNRDRLNLFSVSREYRIRSNPVWFRPAWRFRASLTQIR